MIKIEVLCLKFWEFLVFPQQLMLSPIQKNARKQPSSPISLFALHAFILSCAGSREHYSQSLSSKWPLLLQSPLGPNATALLPLLPWLQLLKISVPGASI